jgi:hypothetical protein
LRSNPFFQQVSNRKEKTKKAVTFFEKKVTKKTFAPGGFWTAIAVNRLRWRRLTAIAVQKPPGAKVFCALFFKKALLSFLH